MASPEWYLAVGNEHNGPLTVEELLKAGLRSNSLVWRRGMPSWVAAVQVPELTEKVLALPSAGLETPPPVPPPYCDPLTAYPPRVFGRLYTTTLILSLVCLVVVVPLEVYSEFVRDRLEKLGWLFLALLIAAPTIVVSCILLYRAWNQITDGEHRTSPGKAVGFCFIPLFNLYWYFVAYLGLAEDLNKYTAARRIPAKPISTGLAITYCVLLVVETALIIAPGLWSVLGFLLAIPATIIYLVLMYSITNVSMAIGRAKLQAIV
jgi:hypothetical protein